MSTTLSGGSLLSHASFCLATAVKIRARYNVTTGGTGTPAAEMENTQDPIVHIATFQFK